MRDELLNEFARIAHYGEQQNSGMRPAALAGGAGAGAVAAEAGVLIAELDMGRPLSSERNYKEQISKFQNELRVPRRRRAERPRYRGKCGEAAMDWPCGNTPLEHFVTMKLDRRGKKKLAATTGGEPVHDASGGRLWQRTWVQASIAPGRMQGTEIHRIHITAARARNILRLCCVCYSLLALPCSFYLLPMPRPFWFTATAVPEQRARKYIPAFEYAIQHGADVLELDLAVTKDNVLVVSHFPFITADYPGNAYAPEQKCAHTAIHSLTLAQLKQYDCGSHTLAAFPKQVAVPGTHIPTFDEVLDLAPQGTFDSTLKPRYFPTIRSSRPARSSLF